MKRKSLLLMISNTITLVLMLFANGVASVGLFFNKTVGDISHKYDTLFAPAGYAFIIWSVIFLLAISFVIYEWILYKNHDPKKYIVRTGVWFIVSNVANIAWLYFWLNEQPGVSVICIFILLFSLICLARNLRLELDDVPVREIFFIWWPVTFYLGWIMVATIACVASWLAAFGWEHFGIDGSTWTIILIVVATCLYFLLTKTRNMREASIVGIWAFIAIAVRQWNDHKNIVCAALGASLILLIISAAHVYKNRYYNIAVKLKRGEW
jgi:hypothetical protein